ncbi:hypothetical protein PR048_004569 [Dryococelus australis]|uniref:Uncharacterized protein n=1 Tax=Dryococelus australis TaxID=614101 RepID=A0ABQ9I5U0_9NEOP|nr:hypothetical protein PR048_004569 [Dryococelus australis]
MKTNHSNDWVQLIRSCKHRNQFKVFVMERKHFSNFGSLGQAQGPFLMKNVNEDVQWLQYPKNIGLVQYKTPIKDEPFSALNIRRRGKGKELLDLLPLIDPVFHHFYHNLKVDDIPANDPDIEEVDPDAV